MTEHMMRPVLSTLTSNGNIMNKTSAVTPSKNKKRTYELCNGDGKALQETAITPTKASSMPTAINGRKSVKRVKADIGAKQPDEAAVLKQRTVAEAEYRAKMKSWIASYKRQFPMLHFYFDACPSEDVKRCSRKIAFLGGTVEQFFSNVVNIVITTRDFSRLNLQPSSANAIEPATRQAREASFAAPTLKNMQQPPVGFRPHVGLNRAEFPAHDVLVKAQNLNMKIWSLKKLRDQVLKNLVVEQTQSSNERSLLSTLHTEKFVGHGEENIAQFKGPYVLVRDMNEEHRPIMCREWSQVANAKDGEWPQWRATRSGRCPFIRDKKAETHNIKQSGGQSKPEQRSTLQQLQHVNASGIQQITSAIQSNAGRSGWSGKENHDSGVANLYKKAVCARRTLVARPIGNHEASDAKKIKADLKMGFCENCKEKFDDLDSHLRSRTHVTYAKTPSNFFDLDDLLQELVRGPPLNDDDDDDEDRDQQQDVSDDAYAYEDSDMSNQGSA